MNSHSYRDAVTSKIPEATYLAYLSRTEGSEHESNSRHMERLDGHHSACCLRKDVVCQADESTLPLSSTSVMR